jgi:hypothetical protein
MMTERGGGLEWADTHDCKFAIKKLAYIGFTRHCKTDPMGTKATRPIVRPPITFRGITIPPSSYHKFLGMLLDQEPRWKEHINYVLKKGTDWTLQF